MQHKLLENVIVPAADLVMNTNFIAELKHWRNSIAFMDSNELKTLQQSRLNKLMAYATANIPYYKSLNLQLTGDAYSDIKKFPILYKHIIKENFDDMFIEERKKLVSEKSSGSSGIQGEVLMSKRENTQYQAAQTFLWEWSGFNLGNPIMQTGMTPKRGLVKSVKDKLFRTQYVTVYNITLDSAITDLEKAKANKVQYLGGYASSLNIYAEAALKAGIDIKFKGVISWGDKLFDHYKSNINKAFANPVITELYGTTEGFVISGTCQFGNHHQLMPQTYLELLDENGNDVKPGEMGFVVVTRLDAYSFPLLRFYLGDLAIKAEGTAKCPCGRPFPIISKIVGRDTDVVKTASGKILIVHFFTGIFEHYTEIKQFRVIQREIGKIEVEYIPSNSFDKDVLETISNKMYEKAGETFVVDWEKVDDIPATPSGKPQVVQSFVAKRQIH